MKCNRCDSNKIKKLTGKGNLIPIGYILYICLTCNLYWREKI